ncbi:MAG: hypothetical protein LQ342_004478 [Letrouitia transgressa]|nr:MAG: hypothetical protein LQ342_004478 [Letrouitia transgressa]
MNIDSKKSHGVDLADDATALLILQLQQSDIEQLLERKKGKGRDGVNSDADIALLAYQRELQETRVVQSDRCMARSFAQAVTSDATVLKEIIEEENSAARDRAHASHLAGHGAPSTSVHSTTTTDCTLHDGLVARLAALYVSADIFESESIDETSKDNTAEAESSSWAASRQTVLVAQNSATSVEPAGRPVHVTSGMKTGCMLERNSLLLAVDLDRV